MQRLEGALHSFTAGALDDDVAILAIARLRAASAPRSMRRLARLRAAAAVDETYEALVGRLFNAFNQRDARDDRRALCATRWSSSPSPRRRSAATTPYEGADGLREYLGDVERVWEELLITPSRVERRGDRLLVIGRVYVRSRELGIRDMPVAWIWSLRRGPLRPRRGLRRPRRGDRRFSRAAA